MNKLAIALIDSLFTAAHPARVADKVKAKEAPLC